MSIYGQKDFAEYFRKIIKIKHIKGKVLYTKAMISERMYQYICHGKHITKYSLTAIGIILQYNYKEIDNFLVNAGYKLSNSIINDAVIMYFLKNSKLKETDLLDEINYTLQDLFLPLLMTRDSL